jgi:uncharacterized beta-barrel protein YwiB (DUF1934 family)
LKKNVMLTIRGTQRIDGKEETIELLTCGQFYRRSETYWISYDESETTGFAGHRTTLHIEPNRITMRRTGLTSSNLVIEKGARHQCSYDTGCGALNIGIMGSHVCSNLTDDGGKVDFTYSMDIDTALQAEQHVTIRVEEDTAQP